MSTLRIFIATAVLIAISGCTWVKLTDIGADVVIVDADKIESCKPLGEVTSSTQDRIVVGRSSGKVQEELYVLARNEAAAQGADTIVAIAAPENGRQSFSIYRCRS